MADASCHCHNAKNISCCTTLAAFIVHILGMELAFGNIAVFTVHIPDMRLAVKMVILSNFLFTFFMQEYTKRKKVVHLSVDIVSRTVRPSVLRASCYQSDWFSTNCYTCLSISSCPRITKPCECETGLQVCQSTKCLRHLVTLYSPQPGTTIFFTIAHISGVNWKSGCMCSIIWR